MSPDSPLPLPRARPSPRFTVASWVILVGGLLLTFAAYQCAVIFRRPGEWLPGIGEALIGIVATAVGSTACGLTALLRREKRCGLAVVPFLAGVGTILYFTWNLVTR